MKDGNRRFRVQPPHGCIQPTRHRQATMLQARADSLHPYSFPRPCRPRALRPCHKSVVVRPPSSVTNRPPLMGSVEALAEPGRARGAA